MFSVVRTTTGDRDEPERERARPAGEMPCRRNVYGVDEKSQDDRWRGEQDVVDEARRARDPAVLAVFGEIDPGEDPIGVLRNVATNTITTLP
jgi:hypothetical protein